MPGTSKARQAGLTRLGKGRHPQCSKTWVDQVWSANQTLIRQVKPDQSGQHTPGLVLQQAAGIPQESRGNRLSQGVVQPSTSGSTGAVDEDWDLEAIADFFGSQP